MTRILLFLSLIATTAYSQQDPLYSQYINNPFVINPAYAGFTNNLNTAISYRQQWSGLDSKPVTINANAHLALTPSMGAGLMIMSDKIGATVTDEIYGSYAYRIKLGEKNTLSFGMQAGVILYKTNRDDLMLLDPNDPVFTAQSTQSKFGIGSGVMLTSDRFFLGFSVPRMLKSKAKSGEINLTEYTQHFYTMGSYIFFINERARFRPSVLAKIVAGAPASVDVNAAFIFHQKYTAGVLTRNFNTYGVFLQAVLKDSFRLGYTFEVPTAKSVGSSFTTHEITLGFRANIFSFHTGDVSSF